MSKCDVQTVNNAFNDAVDAFDKAYKVSGGKQPGKALDFAMSELKEKYPDYDFDPKSVVEPIVNHYKEAGLIAKSYKYKYDGKAKGIDATIEKLKDLNGDKKKKLIEKTFKKIAEEGNISEQDFTNFYAEALGLPSMDKDLTEQAKKMSKALIGQRSAIDEYNATVKEMQAAKDTNENGKLTTEQDNKFKEKFNEIGDKLDAANTESAKQSTEMANLLQKKKYWLHTFGDTIPLNLMSATSLLKNITGMTTDSFYRGINNILQTPIDAASSFITGKRTAKAGSRLSAVDLKKAAGKFKRSWKYGIVDFENELPRTSYIDSTKELNKILTSTNKDKAKAAAAYMFKVHPDFVSRALQAPDAFMYEVLRQQELGRIASEKGLEGAERTAFMIKPDEESQTKAKNFASEQTFKGKVPEWIDAIAKYDPSKSAEKMIEEGANYYFANISTGLINIFRKSTIPFVKTPTNILKVSAKIMFPEYAIYKGIVDATKANTAEDRQLALIKGFTEAIVGFHFRTVMIQAVAMGLVSAGYDDEDPATKDAIEKQLGGPNRMNVSAIMRGLMFMDMTPRDNDMIWDNSALGVPGYVAGVYASAFGKKAADQDAMRQNYFRRLAKSTTSGLDVLTGAFAAAMELPFFTGINELQKTLKGFKSGEEGTFNKYGINFITTAITGLVPATVQKFSMAADENKKQVFEKEKSFGENLSAALGYKFLFNSKDLKNRYFALANEGKPKKRDYVLLDSYVGRVLDEMINVGNVSIDNAEDVPITRLAMETRKIEKARRKELFPSAIDDKVSISVRRNNRKTQVQVQLTPEQHEYLMQQADIYRTINSTPFIMSEDWKTTNFDTKTQTLKAFYDQGLEDAKADLKARYPDLLDQEIEKVEVDKTQSKELINRYSVN